VIRNGFCKSFDLLRYSQFYAKAWVVTRCWRDWDWRDHREGRRAW